MRLYATHRGLKVFMSVERLGFDEPQPVWRAYRSVRDEFDLPAIEHVEGTAAGTLAQCKSQIDDVLAEANQS